MWTRSQRRAHINRLAKRLSLKIAGFQAYYGYLDEEMNEYLNILVDDVIELEDELRD